MGLLWFLGSLGAATVVAALTYVAMLSDSDHPRVLRPNRADLSTISLIPAGLAMLAWLGALRMLLGEVGVIRWSVRRPQYCASGEVRWGGPSGPLTNTDTVPSPSASQRATA